MRSVSVSPHVRSGASTATIMRDVAIALTPSLVFGVFVFGLRALVIICLSIVTCLLTEYLWQRLMKLPVTVADGSALVTGMILAVNLPASVPWWIPVMGGVFAILVVKQLFGGIGQNIMNPALAARCFLVISFPALLGSRMPAVGQIFGSDMWAGFGQRMSTMAVDAATTPTPLALLRSGESIDLLQAFLGARSGCIGEVCAPAILLGAVYMLARGVISLHITGTYLVSTAGFVFLLNLLAGDGIMPLTTLAGHMLTGGLLTGAVFMASDYTTSPITRRGQVVYGILLGFLTGLFRVFGTSAEGVSYAIIIGNTLVPLIERVTAPRPFGVPRRQKKGGAAQ